MSKRRDSRCTLPAALRIGRPSGLRAAPARGFSLVELLTTIMLLTVLLGLVIPSIRAATDEARRVSCQTSARSLAQAMLTFASSQKGNLPSGPVERTNWGSPYELFRSPADDALEAEDGWFGSGRLWKRSFVSGGQGFYCPSAPGRGGVPYEQAWPQQMDASRNPVDGKRKIYANFAYRGGYATEEDIPRRPACTTSADASLPILADNPCGGSLYHSDGYNVAAIDGAVRYFRVAAPPIRNGDLPAFWRLVAPPPAPQTDDGGLTD